MSWENITVNETSVCRTSLSPMFQTCSCRTLFCEISRKSVEPNDFLSDHESADDAPAGSLARLPSVYPSNIDSVRQSFLHVTF